MDKETIRLECLKLAVAKAAGDHDEAMLRAGHFVDFVMAEENTNDLKVKVDPKKPIKK